MSVIKLATNNSTPIKRACSECRYYMPEDNVEYDYARKVWRWTWKPPFRTYDIVPTTKGYVYAICTAVGGTLASIVRRSGLCGPEAVLFAPKEDRKK